MALYEPELQEKQMIQPTPAEAVLQVASVYGFEIEPCEATAIAGLVLGRHPADADEGELRYRMMQFEYHSSLGHKPSPRLVDLRFLMNETKTIHRAFVKPTEDNPIQKPVSKRV